MQEWDGWFDNLEMVSLVETIFQRMKESSVQKITMSPLIRDQLSLITYIQESSAALNRHSSSPVFKGEYMSAVTSSYHTELSS